MESRLAAVAGPPRSLGTWVLAAVALGGPGVALAAPKSGPAKVMFDRGLAAYQRGEYEAASTALGKSYTLEADVETLFAWAQSERQLDHCDKAVGLYRKLLKSHLPAANAEVIRTRLNECKAVLAASKPEPDPTDPDPDEVAKPEPPPQPKPRTDDSPWWHDPVGDTLVIAGGIGVGLGIGYLLAASSAAEQRDAANGVDLDKFAHYASLADRDGTIGVTALAVGGVALTSGIAWYVLHRHPADPAVTAWLTPNGSGVAILGRF